MATASITGQPSTLTLDGARRRYEGSWRLVGEILEWEIEGKAYRLESGNDLSAVVMNFLTTLGDRILRDRVRLRACLTCKSFFMSSMARDMGRGQRGTCNLHCCGVEICYLCKDYERSEVQ
jgi:hypothetical protein